jgi:hypothetical protein
MIKLIVAVKRNAAMSPTQFHEYWRTEHAGQVSSIPACSRHIRRTWRLTTVVALLGSCIGAAFASPPPAAPDQIVGETYRVEPAYYVACHVPNAEVDKVLQAVAAAVKLEYGKYDQVAFIDAPGMEQFRPMADSKAGDQPSAGRAPTTNVSFSVPRDVAVLKKALDAIHQVHSYEEPVVYVQEVWRTRHTGGDDKNPNKWWNRKP